MSWCSNTGRRALLFALVVASATANAEVSRAYHWQREAPQLGFAVYTSATPSHSFDAVKVTATLDASILTLIETLQDFEHYASWYHKCSRVSVLERPAQTARVMLRSDGTVEGTSGSMQYLLFFVQQVPFLDDRWTILRTSHRISGKALVLEFQSVDSYPYRASADTVRMRLRGAWTLEPLGLKRTRVTLFLDVDPNVSAPAFLVDPELRDVAVETMHGLERISSGE